MHVRCVTNQHPDGRLAALTPGETYEVIGIEADDLRVIDDRGYPVLFEPEMFEKADLTPPPGWTSKKGEEGELYASPPSLARPGFWEDYFDGNPAARLAFSRFLNNRLRSPGAA